MGKDITGFDEEIWSRESIVYTGNYAKFTQNPWLYDQLILTKETTLVNASPEDIIWGIGMSTNDPRNLEEKNWKGQNLLGKILTSIREDLKKARAIFFWNKEIINEN